MQSEESKMAAGRIGWHGQGEERGRRGGGIDQPHSPTAHRCMRGRDPVSGICSGSATAFSLPICDFPSSKSRRTSVIRIREGKAVDRAVSVPDEDARRTPDNILRGTVILQVRPSVAGLRLPVQHSASDKNPARPRG